MRYSNTENQEGARQILQSVRNVPVIGVVYRGKVIDNKDPSNTGRVKINIPALYSRLSLEDTPWALPCLNMASYNSGSFVIPQINDNVWVIFENNDIFKPVYIGSMYTTGSSLATQAGSGIAPPYQNHVPYEGLNPDHYVVMKTPKGSGLWMNDERGTTHMYSANGGQIDLEEDRTTVSYPTGGTATSMEGRYVIFSPSEACVDIDDNGAGGPTIIIMRNGQNLINLTENQGISIKYSEGTCENSIHLGNDNITISRNKDEQNISLSEDSLTVFYKDNVVKIESGKIEIKEKGTGYIKLEGGEIEIKADSKIRLSAPVIEFDGAVEGG